MNVILTDNKGIAVPTIHCQCIIACLEDLTFLNRDMVSPDEPHSTTSTLEAYAFDGQVCTVNKLNVIVLINVIGRARQKRFFSICSSNNNGFSRSTFGGNRPSAVLRIDASTQDQLIAWLKGICDSFKFLLGIHGCGVYLKDTPITAALGQEYRQKAQDAQDLSDLRRSAQRALRQFGKQQTSLRSCFTHAKLQL
jgi:hypothetical protein